MFCMGFTEIVVIAIIAILFIGPDKLPSMMVDIAKFFRQVKSTIGNVKESIEGELHVSDIQQEVLNYKKELLDASNSVKESTHIDQLGNLNSLVDNVGNDILSDINEPVTPKEPQKPEEVTFKKKKKSDKKDESKDMEETQTTQKKQVESPYV